MICFRPCKKTLVLTPLSNPSRTHWFTKLDLGGVLTWVCCWLPIWGKFVHDPPGTVSHTVQDSPRREPQPHAVGLLHGSSFHSLLLPYALTVGRAPQYELPREERQLVDQPLQEMRPPSQKQEEQMWPLGVWSLLGRVEEQRGTQGRGHARRGRTGTSKFISNSLKCSLVFYENSTSH